MFEVGKVTTSDFEERDGGICWVWRVVVDGYWGFCLEKATDEILRCVEVIDGREEATEEA